MMDNLILFVPYIIMLLLTRVNPLYAYTIVYILLTVAASGINYLLDDYRTLVWTIIIALGFLLFTILLSGTMGNKIASSSYKNIIALGLFPWTYSISTSVFFIFAAIIILAVLANYRKNVALKAVGLKKMNIARARLAVQGTEKEELFLQKASIILTIPMMASAILSILIILGSEIF